MAPTKQIAILIFDDVEILDFCGPFEVFAVAGQTIGQDVFNVYTVAERSDPVTTRYGLSVTPHYTIHTCPSPDIVIVPGGRGTRREQHNAVLIEWIAAQNQRAELMLSVCTGALLFGRAGLLDGLAATTHHSAFDLLRDAAPHATQHPEQRFVDNGRIITSAGISAGIDMSLHVVAKLLGVDHARQTAAYMEYHWHAP